MFKKLVLFPLGQFFFFLWVQEKESGWQTCELGVEQVKHGVLGFVFVFPNDDLRLSDYNPTPLLWEHWIEDIETRQ